MAERDVIEVLEQDHREVEQMFAVLESLRGASTEEDWSRRKAVTEQVTIELVRTTWPAPTRIIVSAIGPTRSPWP